MGGLFSGFLGGLAFIFRLFGNIARYSGEFFVNLYDLTIFPSLWIERLVIAKRNQLSESKDTETQRMAEETS